MRKTFTRITAILAVLFFSAWGVSAQLTTIVNSNFTNWTVAPPSANGDGSTIYNIPGAQVLFKGTGYNPTTNLPGAPSDTNYPNFFRFGTNMSPQFPVTTLPVAMSNQYFKISPSQDFLAGGKITFVVSSNSNNVAFQVGDLATGELLGEPNIVTANTITTLTMNLPATFSGKKDIIIGRKATAFYLYAIKVETNAAAFPLVVKTTGENPASAMATVEMEPLVYTYSNVADDNNVVADWFSDNTYTVSTIAPAGLTINKNTTAKTVTISGTPELEGTYYYSVKINEAGGNEIRGSVQVAVYEDPKPVISLSTGLVQASAVHHVSMVPVVYTYENVADAANVKFAWYTDNTYATTTVAPDGLNIVKDVDNKMLTLSGVAVYDGNYYYKVYVDEPEGNEIQAMVNVSGKFLCSQANIDALDWVAYTNNTYSARTQCTDGVSAMIPNLSGTARQVVFNVSNCESFTIYADGNSATRYLSYKINDGEVIQTAAWPNGCSSQTFATGNTGNITLTIAGVDGSVYLAYVDFHRSLKISSFEVNGNSASVDHEASIVAIDLEPGTSLTNITPVLAVAPGTSYSPTGAQDFTTSLVTPVVYTVTDGTSTKQYAVTITANGPGTKVEKVDNSSLAFDGQTIANTEKAELRLFDASGRLLLTSNNDINMNGRSKGVYIVKSEDKQLKIVYTK